MRCSGFFGTFLVTAAICFAGSPAFGGGKGCLFGHCADKCTCSSCCTTSCCKSSCCKVYVHVCKVPGSSSAPESGRGRNESGGVSPYAPLVPSVPYMAMPMIQPVTYAAPQQQPRAESGSAGCDACARITKLEQGMEEIGKRLEVIEMILKEHNAIMEKLAE